MVRDLPILAAIAAVGAFVATQKPFDANRVIQVGCLLGLVNAGYVLLAPAQGAKLYGIPSTPLNLMALERMGMVTCSTHAMAYALFEKGASVETAIGVCAFITAVVMLKCLLNEEPQKLGLSTAPHLVIFCISAATAYTCFEDTKYTDLIITAFSLVGFVNGLSFALFPDKAAKAYGAKKLVASTEYCFKLLGIFILANGIFVSALYFDYAGSPEKAYAWSWVPGLVSGVVGHFFLDDTSKTGTKPWPKFVWMLVQTVVVATILV